jgi:hypothetical protein
MAMSEIITLHGPGSALHEQAEWRDTVEMLRDAVRKREKDSLSRVSYFIRRLEQELGPLVSSLAVMEARIRGGVADAMDEGKAVSTRARIELLQARLADLRPIIARVRSVPRDDEDGPTPETRAKGRMHRGQLVGEDASILELPECLRDSAMDLRCGWLVRSPSSQHAKAVKLELEARGVGTYGKNAEKLEEQYLGWLREMRRQHVCIWPVDDVVCRARSYAESAKLRRSDPGVVYHLVYAGVTIYHVLFPPVDTTRSAGV